MSNAEVWGYREQRSNPCYKLPKFKGRKIERFLDAEERARLEESLAQAEHAPKGHPHYVAPGAIAVVRLLAMTGARRGEILDLRWSMVDLDRGWLALPDSKTGQKLIPLSPTAVNFLRAAKKTRNSASAWVCTGENDGPVHNIGRAWESIRTRAGLEDVRLHDLRHAAASDAAAAGLSLFEIGLMLGHKNPQTTQRYAHLAGDLWQEAARRMGEQIDKSTREGAERLRRKRAAGGDTEPSNDAERSATCATVIPFPGGKR